MRHIATILLAVAALTIFAPSTAKAESDLTFSVDALWGRRIFGTWDNADYAFEMDDFRYQMVFGVEAEVGVDWVPINLWLGYTYSTASLNLHSYDFEADASFNEVYVGVRGSVLSIYAGAALTVINGGYSGTSAGESVDVEYDTEYGLLANVGITFDILMVNVGVDGRLMTYTEKSDYLMFSVRAGISL